MKKILILLTAILLASCSYDENIRKYGGGINGAIDGIKDAVFCGTAGIYLCGITAGTEGYINGKQEVREDINNEEQEEIINEIAKENKGIETSKDKCAWYNPFC